MLTIKEILKSEEKAYALLIGLFLSFLPLGAAFSSITLAALGTFSAWQILKYRYKPKLTLAGILPIGLFTLFLLSLTWSIDIDLTKKGLGRMITLMLIPVMLWTMPEIKRVNRNFIFEVFTTANCLFGVLFLGTSLVNYFRTNSLSVLTYHDLVDVLDLNSIYISAYFLFSVAYLLSKKGKSLWDVLRTLFLSGMIVLLSSKMLILTGLFIFLIEIFIRKGFRQIKRPRVWIPVIVIAGLLYFSGSKVMSRFLDEQTTNIEEVLTTEKFKKVYPWTGTSFRALQLRILYEQTREESIFWKGFGLFASRVDVAKRHEQFNTYYTYHQYNYHNNYAQVFAESGIFGLLILLAMLVITFIKAYKRRDWHMAYFAIILSFLFLSESMMWVQRGLFFAVMIYSIMHRSENTNINA